jgi:hypothetical protein
MKRFKMLLKRCLIPALATILALVGVGCNPWVDNPVIPVTDISTLTGSWKGSTTIKGSGITLGPTDAVNLIAGVLKQLSGSDLSAVELIGIKAAIPADFSVTVPIINTPVTFKDITIGSDPKNSSYLAGFDMTGTLDSVVDALSQSSVTNILTPLSNVLTQNALTLLGVPAADVTIITSILSGNPTRETVWPLVALLLGQPTDSDDYTISMPNAVDFDATNLITTIDSVHGTILINAAHDKVQVKITADNIGDEAQAAITSVLENGESLPSAFGSLLSTATYDSITLNLDKVD